ncbi:hypothetical protein [Mucilaginibacter conchicola]|nr:hypothetical protein [Mucilaginibacter conchicola]
MKKLFKLPQKVSLKRHPAAVVKSVSKAFPTDTDTTTTSISTTRF